MLKTNSFSSFLCMLLLIVFINLDSNPTIRFLEKKKNCNKVFIVLYIHYNSFIILTCLIVEIKFGFEQFDLFAK